MDEVEPPAWRRIRARETLSAAPCTLVVQIAVGWQDTHLHARMVGERRLGRPEPEEPESEVAAVLCTLTRGHGP